MMGASRAPPSPPSQFAQQQHSAPTGTGTGSSAAVAAVPMDTRSRHVAQRQLLSALQAHKGWAAATASGKQAMSATINQLLLLREIERSGSDWGPLAAFDRLPERVAARLRRRAAAQLAKLSAAHEALCVQFKQMRFAAEQLRQLQDTLVNAAPPGVAQPPALLVHSVLTIECAVNYARELTAMYGKELMAKRLLISALTEHLQPRPAIEDVGHVQGQQEEDEEEDEDGGRQALDRDLGGVYVSSWMLQPMLCTARVDLILAAFKSEVGTPAPHQPVVFICCCCVA
jgi:hypothetical protein